MNSHIEILVKPLPLQQSLDEVGKMIQQIKSLNIQQKYELLENRIQALQLLDIKIYKNHFDNFMGIQEPITPLDHHITIEILENLTEQTRDYVNHLSSVHGLLHATHSNTNYTALTKNTFDLYSEISSQSILMRELFEKATKKLEQISRDYKGSFTVDSREIEYSRYLLTMTGSISRIEKEVKSYADQLYETAMRLTARLKELNQDMRAINQKVECISQITDYLHANCSRKLAKIKYARNLGAIMGGIFLILMVIISFYEQSAYKILFIPFIMSTFYIYLSYREHKKYQAAMHKSLSQLKEVMNSAIQAQKIKTL
ncbi:MULTISPECIES: hypothetical protein [Acinetobacter]|uniref:Uncharacterized protein n=1 Tax=Acinetobacter indicus TaxID=756892 RepID=A0A6C0Y6S8_9GAMM|nr:MULTISPECIES: hypothetical protein [Acinetobacter]QIC71878.1 hypothetical protein FSC09_15930 [Acinetobacter indicus]QKQ71414.1 hypothetical protein E5Y90_14380 [Acinetobacter sp. 10FS3-1]